MVAQDLSASTEGNSSALVITASTMLVLTWISVSLRVYVRGFLTKGFSADDWWMVASQANFTVSCAFILRGCHYGLGRHNRSLDVSDEINALKWQVLATATYVLNMWLVKMSIGIFLLRIATQRRYRYTLYGSLVVVSVWSLALFFWNIFQCNPIEAQWDYTILRNDPSAHCVSAEEVVHAAYALSVMTILSDWFFALLPIPMVWNVKMTLQARLTVMAILGLGIFASVATLVRLKFLSDLTDLDDILFAGTDAMVWTLIEPGLAIIASSLATIRPLLRACGITGFQSTQNSRSAFSRNKIPPQTPRFQRSRTSKMPGFGSADVTLLDVEAGYSRTNGAKSPTITTSTWGNTTTIKSQANKSAPHMRPVEELAEERDNGNMDASAPATTLVGGNSHKRITSPTRSEAGFSKIAISRSTSITTTPNNITRSGAGVAPHDRTHGIDPPQSTPNSVQGRTWLSSDQGSTNSSTVELSNIQTHHQHDEADLLPYSTNGGNRFQRK